MEHAEQPTKRAPQGSSWSIDDAVVRLRLWATESAHALPEPRKLKLGSGANCDVRLHDRTGQPSREHAMLVPEADGWRIRDLGSRNGLWGRGNAHGRGTAPCRRQIQLGGVILVAESLGFIRLRSLACRLIGWSAERQGAVDEALQDLRDGATRRTPLVLVGDGELVPVARRLHRATLGPDVPFVLHDGGDAAAALEAAAHGTLCVPIRRRAAASAIVDAIRAAEAASRPRLVLCAHSAAQAAAVGAKPGRLAVIALPPLSARGDETGRLIHETAQDVVAELGAPSSGFTMRDLERLQAIRFSGLSDLEDSIRRVVAIRTWGVTAGAKRLGLKHSSLSQWARSRKRRLTT